MTRMLPRPISRAVIRAAALLPIGAAVGCGPKPDQLSAFLRAYEQNVSASSYRVQPPDGLEISSPEALEIDGEYQVVRADGKITLRLLGEVKVAGLTPVEIADKLEQLLSRYYVNPNVMVRVSTANSKRYFVFGEVGGPGPYPYTGNDTLLKALALAQPTFLAWKSQVRVVRPSHDENERRELVVDVDEIIQHGKTQNNVLLQEGDVIYVPPTPLAWVGLRLRELLFPVPFVGNAVNSPIDLRDSGARYDQPVNASARRSF
ncbi:MAG: polysaccharide export protein [Phycisphaerae bacterium]|nr:polysaccharide export protein [Phycisphaerae bacterium]